MVASFTIVIHVEDNQLVLPSSQELHLSITQCGPNRMKILLKIKFIEIQQDIPLDLDHCVDIKYGTYRVVNEKYLNMFWGGEVS